MKDAVSIQRVKSLHPLISDEVFTIIGKIEAKNDFIIRIVNGYRSFEEQAKLYAQGRTTPGLIVTKAKPGRSYHQYRLAFDFVILYDKDGNGTYEALSWDVNYDFDKDGVNDWMEVVNEFKAHDYEWGGDFHSIVDNPHIQKTFGLSINELLARYKAKDWYMGKPEIVRI